MRMTHDELEYAISQYLDGVLPPLERAALEERLAGDAQARAMLEEYRKLDGVLQSSLPVPQVDWATFSAQTSKALDEAEAPIRHYKLHTAWPMRIAIAAMVMLAFGVGIFLMNQPQTQKSQPIGVAVISGPSIAESAGPVVAEIKVGPPPTMAFVQPFEDDIIVRPAIVLIDPASTSGQDNDLY